MPSVARPPRHRKSVCPGDGSRAVVLLLLFGSGLGACLAPRPQDEAKVGSVEEFGRLLAEGGEPVQGTEEAGQTSDLEGDPHALPDPEQVIELEEAQPLEPSFEESPYLRFGEYILVKEFEDAPTFITKPYRLPPSRAQRVIDLLRALDPFPIRLQPPPAEGGETPPLDPRFVEYQILEKWDEEFYGNLKAELPAATAPTPLADVLVVTATADLLEEFEYYVELFAAGVPQIELEAKIIQVAETDSDDIGVNALDGLPVFQFGSSNFVKSLGFGLGNLADGSEALLTLGAVQDDTVFNAVIEAISSWDNVSIDSRPKTVVRSGGVARLESTTDIPFVEIKTLTPQGDFTANTTYKKVGVQLYISPRVVGSKTMALDVHLEGSQLVGSATTFGVGDNVVETPVINFQTAKTVVYLEPGQTLVIGGLTQTREQETIRKIPLLGDIPILGFFFRSTFTELQKDTVIFAISPRIIQRSDFTTDL